MTYFKRVALLALLVLLGVFAFQNQKFLLTQQELSFFKYHATLAVGFWMLLGFLAGILVYLSVDLPRTLTLKRELRRKSHDLARLQYEMTRQPPPAPGAAPIPPGPDMPPPLPPEDIAKRLGI